MDNQRFIKPLEIIDQSSIPMVLNLHRIESFPSNSLAPIYSVEIILLQRSGSTEGELRLPATHKDWQGLVRVP